MTVHKNPTALAVGVSAELYDEEWTIPRGVAGVFGKQFFNYVEDEYSDRIKYVGTPKKHAKYEIL